MMRQPLRKHVSVLEMIRKLSTYQRHFTLGSLDLKYSKDTVGPQRTPDFYSLKLTKDTLQNIFSLYSSCLVGILTSTFRIIFFSQSFTNLGGSADLIFQAVKKPQIFLSSVPPLPEVPRLDLRSRPESLRSV